MEWRFDSGAAIYAQMVARMKEAIASGALAPGARLPAVRELALEAGVNPNTAQRALAELEREGLIYAVRTSGRFVTEDEGAIETVRRELADARAEGFITAMAALGYTGDGLEAFLKDYIRKKEE